MKRPRPEMPRQAIEQVPGELSLLVQALETHNAGHGEGARMGQILGGMLRSVAETGGDPDMEQVGAQVAGDAREDTQSGLTKLNAVHQKTLDAFGLTLVHEPSSDPDKESSGKVLLRAINPDKLITGIGKVKSMEGPARTKLLSSLVASLEQQVRSADFDDLSNTEVVVLYRLGDIAIAIREADPTTDRTRLETYAKFEKTGRIFNYLEVEKENLWILPGKGFGPADWVSDTTPVTLEEKWKKAYSLLLIQEKDSEFGVGPELREHLLLCLSASVDRLKTTSWPEERKVELLEVLKKYSTLLVGGSVN